MTPRRLFSDLRVTNGDGMPRLFQEYLADFNILAIRRVPTPSHGPSTRLLSRLLAQNRGTGEMSVCGFDIRSPDRPCETCHSPHIVYTGPDLATICDADGSILRHFGVVGYDRFFVVRSVPQVIDIGSIVEVSGSETQVRAEGTPARHRLDRSPPDHSGTAPPRGVFNGRLRSCRASN